MNDLSFLLIFLFFVILFYRYCYVYIRPTKTFYGNNSKKMSETTELQNQTQPSPVFLTQYPWSEQSQEWPFRPSLYDNTNAVMSDPPAQPLIRTYTAEQVFGTPSSCYRDPKQFLVPSANPTFMAPYVPYNIEPAVARAATVSSDQWMPKPIGWEKACAPMRLSGL